MDTTLLSLRKSSGFRIRLAFGYAYFFVNIAYVFAVYGLSAPSYIATAVVFVLGIALLVPANLRKVWVSEAGIHQSHLYSSRKLATWSEIKRSEVVSKGVSSVLTLYGEKDALFTFAVINFERQDLNTLVRMVKERSGVETIDRRPPSVMGKAASRGGLF